MLLSFLTPACTSHADTSSTGNLVESLSETTHIFAVLPWHKGAILQKRLSIVHVDQHLRPKPTKESVRSALHDSAGLKLHTHPEGTMMMGTPPFFSALSAGACLCAACCCGAGCFCCEAETKGCSVSGAGSGTAGAARNDALVSMPNSSTSRVPSRSCQNCCSCTPLYLESHQTQ